MRFLKTAVCVITVFLLCGCYDYSELNMQKLVSGAGVDKSGKTISVTVITTETEKEAFGEGQKITAEGKSFFDAVREISSITDKKLYWGHARVIVIGQEAINGIDSILDTVLRVGDVYPDIAFVVAKETSAKKLLESSDGDVTESIYNMFANEENSRRYRPLQAFEVLRLREEYGVYILPTVTLNGDEFVLSGGAVIRNGKLSGYLSGEEQLILSLMTEKSAGGYLPVLEDGTKSVSFEILANDIKKETVAETVKIRQECVLSPAEVSGDMTGDEMSALAKAYLEERAKALFNRAVKEGLGDIFAIGKGKNFKKIEIESSVRISNILGGRR